jgi:hypothetical protein
MRTAISRERSAVRAAKRLPRLAHAASRMSPAKSISPAIKVRAGRPSVSPTSPGRDNENFRPSSSFGYDFASEAAIVFRSDAAAAAVTPGFKWPMTQVKWEPRISSGSHPPILRQVHQGRPQVRREEKLSPAEVGRRNSDNCVGTLVYLNDAAHRSGIAVEVAVPIGVAQYHVRHAVLSMLIGTMDEPTKIRLNAQGIEVIAADHIWPDDGRFPVAGIKSDATDNVIGNQGFETVVSVAQVEIIRIRLRGSVSQFEGSLQHVEVLGVWHIERAQN